MALVEVNNATYMYPSGTKAVDDLSFSVNRGERVAVIGQNGAGKTTTAKMLNGLLRPTSGSVTVDSFDTSRHTVAEMSHKVGYVFQNPDDQIFHATVAEEVAFGLRNGVGSGDEALSSALGLCGLSKVNEANPFDLPLSIRKFISIASILVMNADVIVLDEPTAGQDMEGDDRLGDIIAKLTEDGKAVITITHDMEFVSRLFDRVIVMANGHILMDNTPSSVFWNEPVLEAAHLEPPSNVSLCRELGLKEGLLTDDDVASAIIELRGGCRISE